MTTPVGQQRRIAQVVLRYLDRRPRSSDTLDGVCDWWVARQRIFEAREAVRGALDLLVAQGHVQVIERADGEPLYRASAERREDGSGGTGRATVARASRPRH